MVGESISPAEAVKENVGALREEPAETCPEMIFTFLNALLIF